MTPHGILLGIIVTRTVTRDWNKRTIARAKTAAMTYNSGVRPGSISLIKTAIAPMSHQENLLVVSFLNHKYPVRYRKRLPKARNVSGF